MSHDPDNPRMNPDTGEVFFPETGEVIPDLRQDPRFEAFFFAADVESMVQEAAPKPPPSRDELDAAMKKLGEEGMHIGMRCLAEENLDEALRFFGMAARYKHPGAREAVAEVEAFRQQLVQQEIDNLTSPRGPREPDRDTDTRADAEWMVDLAHRIGDRIIAAAHAEARDMITQAHVQADTDVAGPTSDTSHDQEGHHGQ